MTTLLGEKLLAALDAKTAVIKQTINAWDTHEDQIRKPQQEKAMEQPHYNFAVSNNVMRETFNAVKNSPKLKHREYVEMLRLSGFKENSTGAVLYQLIRAGQVVRDEQGQLSVTQEEYTPMKAWKKKSVVVLDKAPEEKPRQIVIVKRGKNAEQGIAALNADSGSSSLERPVSLSSRGFHPSAIVDGLTVLHARELYDYLKKIFTGETK